MPFPPDIFLIGAQKAGTTALSEMLDRHPRITVATPKEPHFFTRDWEKGLDWYRRCFQGPEQNLFVDASTSNAGAPLEDSAIVQRSPLAGVPGRIYEVSPHARFIYIVRDPIDRTYSAYWHDVRAGAETRSFRAAIQGDPSYLRVSDYAGQLKLFLQYFDLDSFLILRFEELQVDPQAVARRCFGFLGLEAPSPEELSVGVRNRSYAYNRVGRVLSRSLAVTGSLKTASRAARRVLPESGYAALGRLLTRGIPPMDLADREYLEAYFRPRNREFRALTGIETGYSE